MNQGPNDFYGDNAVPTGVTWDASWRLTTRTGSPLNPTGWTARSQARKWQSAEDVLFTWSTGPAPGQGLIDYTTELFADPNDGVEKTYYRIHLRLTPTLTEGWDWDRMYYDIEMTAPDSRKARPVPGGWMEISRDSTRS